MKRKQIIALVLSAVLAAGSAAPGSVLPASAAEQKGTVSTAEEAEPADTSHEAEESSEEDAAAGLKEDTPGPEAAGAATGESDDAESGFAESGESGSEDAEAAETGSEDAEAAEPGSEAIESTDSEKEDPERSEPDAESPEEVKDDQENPASDVSAEADAEKEEKEKETEETAESVTAQTGTTAAEAGNERAALAIDAFCDSVLKYIGAFYTELGGMDYLVFTGGIGENSVPVREKVCARLACLGVKFDSDANRAVRGEGVISAPDSPVKVLVLPTNEEVGIAQTIQEKVLSGELRG